MQVSGPYIALHGDPMEPTFFETPATFRRWLRTHHAKETELWVGFHRKATGRPSLTWPESVDEALCFGWIDGIRKSVDEYSYTIRFTPRKPRSIWSDRNIRRMEALLEEGRVAELGREAWARREEDRSRRYAFEQGEVGLPPGFEKRFRANGKAWAFFSDEAAHYRKVATWWVISAKRESTRERRLAALIEDSEAGRRIGPMRR